MRRKANEKMYKKQINGKYGIEEKVEEEIMKVGGRSGRSCVFESGTIKKI